MWFSVYLRQSLAEVDLEVEESFVIRHVDEVRDVQFTIADDIEIVVEIEEKDTVRCGVRRQDIGAEDNCTKEVDHLRPVFVSRGRCGAGYGKRTPRRFGVGGQESAVCNFLRAERSQSLPLPAWRGND